MLNMLVISHSDLMSPVFGDDKASRLSYDLLARVMNVHVVTTGPKASYTIRSGNLHINHQSTKKREGRVGNVVKRKKPSILSSFVSSSGIYTYANILSSTRISELLSGLDLDSYDFILVEQGPINFHKTRHFSKPKGTRFIERFHTVGSQYFVRNLKEWTSISGTGITEVLLPSYLNRALLSKWCIRKQLRQCKLDNIVAVSEYDSCLIKNHSEGSPPNRMSTIFLPQVDDKLLNEKALTVPTQFDDIFKAYVLFFGSPRRSLGVSLSFLRWLAQRHPDVNFLILGITDTLRYGLSYPRNVKFLGVISDQLQFLSIVSHAKAVIFPLIESQGLQTKLIPALCLGKTILATSVVAKGYGKHIQESGVIIEDSPLLLDRRLTDVLKEKGDTGSMSKRSLDYYHRYLSNENFVSSVKAFISSMV